MEGKRTRFQSESQPQSVILLTKIKGYETIQIKQIILRVPLQSRSKNRFLCIFRIHSSFARRPHQRTLTAHSHRSLQKLLHPFQLQLLLCLRFAVRKGTSHASQEIPRPQTSCHVESDADSSETFAREQA